MKISVIIPAKNEEKFLPVLLESIKNQDFDDYEVIVADAFSTDGTREIAAGYGARVVDGGMPGPGRNAGARAAKGEFLVFLDADVVIPEHFLKNLYNEMQERYIDVATCAIRPMSDIQLDRVIHNVINLTVMANLRINPMAFGFCIFITKRLFDRIGGFDETIKVAEDNDLVKRASDHRPLRYLNSTHVKVSVRRYEKEGRLQYAAKGIKLNVYRAFRGEIRYGNDVLEYDFGGYDGDYNRGKALDKIEKALIRMETKYRRQLSNMKTWRISGKEHERSYKLLTQLRSTMRDFSKSDSREEDKDKKAD